MVSSEAILPIGSLRRRVRRTAMGLLRSRVFAGIVWVV